MRVRVALLALAALAGDLHAADAEAKGRAAIAKVWVDYGTWLAAHGQKLEAERALAEAREAAADASGMDALAAAVEALAEEAAPAPALEDRRKRAHADAAKLYEKLAGLDHEKTEEARFQGFLLKAAGLDPSKARLGKLLGLAKQAAGNKASVDSAGRLLLRLREIDPAGTAKGLYDPLERQMAEGDVAVLRGEGHACVGYLSLPDGWKAKGEWPVLVAVEGAGCNFLGAARGFATSRGSRGFLVLTPCSLSNTNELEAAKYPFYDEATLKAGDADRIAFDLAGLEALLQVVKRRYGGGERIGITGFSGGGNLCYAWLALHPDRTLFAAPACANFTGMGLRDAAAIEGGGPPVHILTGAMDPHKDLTHGKFKPGIEEQTDAAVAALARLAFANVRRTMLPGMGHAPCAREVWAFADEAVAKR
ncbi:MAG: hypothetical protein ACT4PV_13995 [Planctomycetaceae bacterium]